MDHTKALAVLRRLDGYLSNCLYGDDHPWRVEIKEALTPTASCPDGRIAYQITGWGETDFPEVTFADTLDAAKDAVIAMVYDDPEGGHTQATEERLLDGLDEGAELPWETRFEIGGVEVRKVFVRPVANGAAKLDDWHMVCGHWKDETVAIHGKDGLIASGITTHQAKLLIRAHSPGAADRPAINGAAGQGAPAK